jgi:glycosyltransferase involved in cell wall biosynthesis
MKAIKHLNSIYWAWGHFGGVFGVARRLKNILRKEGPSGLFKKFIALLFLIKNRSVGGPDVHLERYSEWVEEHDTLTEEKLEQYRNELVDLPLQPLISVLVPIYNCPEKFLIRMIESVESQVYSNWELCLADDCSTDPHVKRVIDEYAKKDSRIKVIHREKNGHISEATNSCLDIAQGEFIALLDHDDELREHSLFWMVKELNVYPEVQFIYSDEDKIDEEGVRFLPHFKPDWSPELFYSQNYLCHFSVIKRQLVEDAGRYRKGYEGSQDFDLFLRCTAKLKGSEIRHIPRILYHWRAIEGSTALDLGEKSYAHDAGVKSLSDFANASYENAEVVGGVFPTTYRIKHKLPVEPSVILIIPTKDCLNLLAIGVSSILQKTNYSNYKILIVNNRSEKAETLEYFQAIQKNERVKVLEYDQPFNFSAINNFAVSQCDSDIVGLINNDIEVINDEWLSEMVSHAVLNGAGCVGAKLYYPNDTIQHGGVILWRCGIAEHLHKGFHRSRPGYFAHLMVPLNVTAVTAACLVVKRDVYLQVGGMDEALKVAYNDVDFCLKVRELGKRNIWLPYAELYHHESVSRGADDSPEKAKRLQQESEILLSKWKEKIPEDPYFNPNFSLENLNIEPAFPPRIAL